MRIFFICLLLCQVLSVLLPVRVYQTAQNTNDRLTRKADIHFTGNVDSSLPLQPSEVITVNTNATYQTILGFGAAFTEASAYMYSQMKPSIQNQIRELYFGKTGIHYTVCRTHINSCDFSLASYSFDDTAGDYSLQHFNISHLYKWMLPFIKDCLKTSADSVKIFGTPWSPPAWMKSNGEMDGSDRPGLIQDSRVFKAWSLYLSKSISAYKAAGVPFWGLTVQNEPEFPAPWEACVYTPEQERDFIKNYLGPQLQQDHPNISLMIYDHNKDHIVDWVQAIYSDSEAAKYVAGTAFHWYSGPQFENVEQAHNLFPGKFLLASEACNCPGVVIDSWPRAESYAYDVIGDLNSWAVGWVDWNMVLDPQGGPNHLEGYCDAHVIAYVNNQSIHIQPSYYYYGQITKFFVPGSVRIQTTCGSASCTLWFTSALTPYNSVVTVVMNQADNSVPFTLSYGSLVADYTLPPHAIVTFEWKNIL